MYTYVLIKGLIRSIKDLIKENLLRSHLTLKRLKFKFKFRRYSFHKIEYTTYIAESVLYNRTVYDLRAWIQMLE